MYELIARWIIAVLKSRLNRLEWVEIIFLLISPIYATQKLEKYVGCHFLSIENGWRELLLWQINSIARTWFYSSNSTSTEVHSKFLSFNPRRGCGWNAWNTSLLTEPSLELWKAGLGKARLGVNNEMMGCTVYAHSYTVYSVYAYVIKWQLNSA